MKSYNIYWSASITSCVTVEAENEEDARKKWTDMSAEDLEASNQEPDNFEIFEIEEQK